MAFSRRLFLGGLIASASAPAIVRAESLMRITPPKLVLPSHLRGQTKYVSAIDELAWFKVAPGESVNIRFLDSEGDFLRSLRSHHIATPVRTVSPALFVLQQIGRHA